MIQVLGVLQLVSERHFSPVKPGILIGGAVVVGGLGRPPTSGEMTGPTQGSVVDHDKDSIRSGEKQ